MIMTEMILIEIVITIAITIPITISVSIITLMLWFKISMIMIILIIYRRTNSNDNTHVDNSNNTDNTNNDKDNDNIIHLLYICIFVLNSLMGKNDLTLCPDHLGQQLEVLLTLRADNKCTLRYLVLDKAFVVDSSGVHHKVQSHHNTKIIPATFCITYQIRDLYVSGLTIRRHTEAKRWIKQWLECCMDCFHFFPYKWPVLSATTVCTRGSRLLQSVKLHTFLRECSGPQRGQTITAAKRFHTKEISSVCGSKSSDRWDFGVWGGLGVWYAGIHIRIHDFMGG